MSPTPPIRFLLLALLLFTLLPAHAQGGKSLYAKKKGVKITKEKSPLSEVIAQLKCASRVEVLAESGRFRRVRLANGKIGWVYLYRMSGSPPKKQSSGAALFSTPSSRLQVREARTGGSIRSMETLLTESGGLHTLAEQYGEEQEMKKQYLHSIDRMARRFIPQKTLEAFQRQGALGPFSGAGP